MMGARAFLLLLSVTSLTSSLEPQGGGQARHTFVTDPSNLWSNGRVNYRFETDVWNGVEEPIFTDLINQPPLLKEDRGCSPSVQVFIWQRTYSSGSYWSCWLIKSGLFNLSNFFLE